jgi:hypothetical protein
VTGHHLEIVPLSEHATQTEARADVKGPVVES